MTYRYNREKAFALADVVDGIDLIKRDKNKQKALASINRGKVTGYFCHKCNRAMSETIVERQKSFGLEPTCVACLQKEDSKGIEKKKGIYYTGGAGRYGRL